MNKIARIAVVIVLMVAVGIVIALKSTANRYCKSIPGVAAVESAIPAAESEIVKEPNALPRLVDLGAGKCIPCKMMAPILEELKSQYQGKLNVVFIDVWEKPDEAKKYKINIIPTQVFFDASGREVFRHSGFLSKEAIAEKLSQMGIK